MVFQAVMDFHRKPLSFQPAIPNHGGDVPIYCPQPVRLPNRTSGTETVEQLASLAVTTANSVSQPFTQMYTSTAA